MQENTVDYCLNTSTIRNCGLNIQEKIQVAAQAGYQGIELWISEIDDYLKTGGNLSELKATLDQNGIGAPNLIAFFQWANPESERRTKALEEARSIFEMALKLDCTCVAAPPAGITEMPDLPLEDIAGYYKDLLKATQDTGVKPLLEFWGHSKILGSLAEAMQMLKLIDDPEVLLLADVFHMAKTEGSFELLGELKGTQIGLFHVNDYPDTPDIRQLTDAQRVYPGDGVAPLRQIFDTLKRIGYSGMFSLELFNKEYEEAGAEQVARTGLEKMKQVVEASSSS
ncbi:TPA: sugar phosphate isomerase/epimerase [Candidatus Poribacteria bacterium]|nr:sugar phosphate isomerase/epimerase [Candidatus Poribacteria bacterium]